MKKFEIARHAVGDLQDIWQHISEDSLDAADRVLDDVFRAFARLAESPGIGHKRQDLTTRNVRFWPVHSYLVIYRDQIRFASFE